MPLYEYRCRTCDDRFELRRTMADASTPAPCPDGHDDTVRLISAFAATGGERTQGGGDDGGGGCCGGACGCGRSS